MILLDTNAILFILTDHRRAKVLTSYAGRLKVSPMSLLELQMLVEVGKLRWTSGEASAAFFDDSRWTVDDPRMGPVVDEALPLGWTRDPFDRFLVAHSRYRRWKLATSDAHILETVHASEIMEL